MLTFGVPVLKLTTGVILNLVHASPKTDCNALTIATLIGGLFGGMLVLCVFKVAATPPSQNYVCTASLGGTMVQQSLLKGGALNTAPSSWLLTQTTPVLVHV